MLLFDHASFNLTDYIYSPASYAEKHGIEIDCIHQFLTPNYCPIFSSLTPRLQKLVLDYPENRTRPDTFSLASTIRDSPPLSKLLALPSTLTSLKIIDVGHRSFIALLYALPSGLLELNLKFDSFHDLKVRLSTIFERIPALTKLCLSYVHIEKEQKPSLPPSLTHLHLYVHSGISSEFLSSLGLRSSSLIHFGIRRNDFSSQTTAHDLSSCFPSTLTSLHLSSSRGRLSITTLPPCITSLKLGGNLLAAVDYFSGPIASLRLLTSLSFCKPTGGMMLPFSPPSSRGEDASEGENSLASNSKAPSFLDLKLLPQSITSLAFHRDFQSISTANVEDLPSSLTSLSVVSCDLEWACRLTAMRPNCSVFIGENPCNILGEQTDTNGMKLRHQFSEHWSPNLDIVAFENAVSCYYKPRRVHISLEWTVDELDYEQMLWVNRTVHPSTKSFTYRPSSEIMNATLRTYSPMPELDYLQTFPALEKLVLAKPWKDNNWNLAVSQLPPTLTHLELNNVLAIIHHGKHLPPLLTFISSDSDLTGSGTSSLSLTQLPHLIYLDTPLWEFEPLDPLLAARRADFKRLVYLKKVRY